MESIDKETKKQIMQVLEDAHLSRNHFEISSFSLGGNNQTFLVKTDSGTFVAKKYFSHPSNHFNRLEHEFSFLSFVQTVVQGMTPKVIAKHPSFNMALYEYIEGAPFQPNEVCEDDIHAAAEFFCQINQSKYRLQAGHINKAAEACFTIEEHLQLIHNRIQQLYKISLQTQEAVLAYELVCQLDEHLKKLNTFSFQSQLQSDQWCLSPSDFGFHNALKRSDRSVCFIDFEYAGWDDPAKMVADFFSQIAVPVPSQFFEFFARKTLLCFPRTGELIERALFLRPVYLIKWCCIALNVFLPYHLEKRKFANMGLDPIKHQRNQLIKAQKLLEQLRCEYAT